MIKKRCRRRKSRRAKRGTYTSTKTGQVCKYRSNWEKVYLEFLDNNPDVVHWEYEPFAIEYVSNQRTGKLRKYYPDVLVEYSGSKVLVEIKPSKRMIKPTVQKKANAAITWCSERSMEFVFVTEVELKELKLI